MQARDGFSAWQLFSLSFGGIIGVGWMVGVGFWLQEAGAVGSMLAFLAGFLAMIPVAMCYSVLASTFRQTGGEIIYSGKLIGPRSSSWIGWILLLIYCTVCAFEAISVGWLGRELVPDIAGAPLYTVLDTTIYAGEFCVGLATLAIITTVQLRGSSSTGNFQLILTILMVIIVSVYVLAACYKGDPANLQPWLAGTGEHGLDGIITVTIMSPFFLAGFNIMAQSLGEASDEVDSATIARVIVLSVLCAFLFYIVVILATGLLLSGEREADDRLAVALAANAIDPGGMFKQFLLLGGLFGLVTTWNAVFMGAVRVLMTLVKLGKLANPWKTSRFNLASREGATWFIAFVSLVGLLAGRGALAPIMTSSGLIFSLLYAVQCGSLIAARRKPECHPELSRDGWFGPVAGFISSMIIVVLAIYSMRDNPAGLKTAQAGIALAWIALGALLLKTNDSPPH